MTVPTLPTMPCADIFDKKTDPKKDGPRALVRIGHALRDRVVAIYEQAGIDLPERRVWVIGEGVFDCEQLIVAFTGLSEGLINAENPQRSPCEVFVNATFKITVVRCVPTADARGNSPLVADMDAATDLSVIDAYLLMKSSCRFDMYGADVIGLHPSALGGMGVESSVEIEEPQGGFQAVTLNITTVIG